MPHKVASADMIKNLGETVAYYKSQIERIKYFSSGEKDAVKSAMDTVREWEFDANFKKDQALATGKDEDSNVARRWQGKQEAFQDVITLFEAPKDVIERYERERRAAESQLEQYKQLDTR